MKQTVEEAAYNYLQKILESSDFEINFEEDNYDAGARDAVLDVTERAYIAGAEWRIIACGIRPKMKCHKLMENTKMNIIRRYHALYMGN